MRSIKLFLAAGAFTLCAQNLEAQQADTSRWVEVTRDEDLVITLDSKTIIDSLDPYLKLQDIEKRYLLTWTRWKHTKIQKTAEGKSYQYSLDEIKVDCEEMRFGVVRSTEYSKDGKAVSSTKINLVEMERAVPETVGEKMVEGICGYWKKRKKK